MAKEGIMKLGHHICESSSVRILVAVLAMFLTLCGGPAGAATEPGTVTIVQVVEPGNLDPTDATRGMTGQVVTKNIAEPLVEMDPADSKIYPRLATSWKQVNPTTWQFFLRKGVKFHDGKDFNAEAVVFNLKRLYAIETMTRGKFFSTIKLEGRALDSHTVEVKMDRPEPLLLSLMTNVPMCSPSTPLDKITRLPIGTGPFKFVKWDAGTQIVLERWDGYWGKQPPVKKAVYVWRGDSSVRAAMVLVGEADITLIITEQDANRPDLDIPYLDSETICMRFGGEWEPPLNDRRVRMAMNYAIDRNALRGTLLSKNVLPATQMYLPSTNGHNPDLKPWPYDPQKAKQLLAEAKKDGVPVDKQITVMGRIAHFTNSDDTVVAIANMLKESGFNVKVKMLEAGVYLRYREKLTKNDRYPTDVGPYIIQLKHDNNKGDASFTAYYMYHTDGSASSVSDKQVDELLEKAQRAMGEERSNYYRQAAKRIHEEIIPSAMLFHLVSYARVSKRINFKPSILSTNEIPLEQITFK
jgi:peptide/nickel transport system substrate-binding protein